jgi:acetyltransferase-like isoleucine patch superfamily enzyme/glycosyltransferase involved in cell wall biosynthesis
MMPHQARPCRAPGATATKTSPRIPLGGVKGRPFIVFAPVPIYNVTMVDVLIQTHNEELNLAHALKSVQGWVNRIFVVDSGSTDRTAEIAREYGATFVFHPWEGYARQKNWALDNLPFESPWVLILDADESITPSLREEIVPIISKPVDSVRTAGFYLNRTFIFLGQAIYHCGYFPSWNLRLFKHGLARYEDREVHEHMLVNGPTAYLKNLMIHEDRRGLEHFVAKHNRYSTLEAQSIYRSKAKWPGIKRLFSDRMARTRYLKDKVVPRLPAPWLFRFFYMYILRLGLLDRRGGWMLSNFIASYDLSVYAKYRELKRLGGKEPPRIAGLSLPEGNMLLAVPKENGAENAVDQSSVATFPQVVTRERSEQSHSGNGDSAQGEHGAVSTLTSEENPPPRAEQGRWCDHAEAARKNGRRDEVADPGSSPITFTRHRSPWSTRLAWYFVQATFFRLSIHNAYRWRALLLRMFGAKLGRQVRIRRTVRIEIPWHLRIGDATVVGDFAILYSLGQITLGRNVTISQYAHLCAGTHDLTTRDFTLICTPITLGDDVWVAADAFVGPGVAIGERTVLGARSSAFTNLPAGVIAVGSPAKAIKPRILRD